MNELTNQLYQRAAGDNPDALIWLVAWNRYCHEVDDMVDSQEWQDPNRILRLLALTTLLHSLPFWLTHAATLSPVILLINSAYADSVDMAASTLDWQRQWADTLRFAGNQMVEIVACLTGGYDHMRALSLKLKTLSWSEHHDAEGRPI